MNNVFDLQQLDISSAAGVCDCRGHGQGRLRAKSAPSEPEREIYGRVLSSCEGFWMSGGANEDGGAAVRLLSRADGCLEAEARTRLGVRQVCPAVWLDSALMVPNLKSLDRMGAIKELVDRMHLTGCVIDSLNFLQSVLDREDLESTVVGAGVAFPHARCRSATRLGLAFGVSRDGVVFHADSCPYRVFVICLLAVPVAGDGGYLPLLGILTGAFRDRAFQTGLMACQTPEEMYRYLYPRFLTGCVDKTSYFAGK